VRVPRPLPSFVPWRRHGSTVFLAAQNCSLDGVVIHAGKLGREITREQGAQAARLCALNLIAALREACDDDLDTVAACVRIGGYVNCVPGFDGIASVIDGASTLIGQLFGGAFVGHARSAIGVVQLPQASAVAVDAVFELREDDTLVVTMTP